VVRVVIQQPFLHQLLHGSVRGYGNPAVLGGAQPAMPWGMARPAPHQVSVACFVPFSLCLNVSYQALELAEQFSPEDIRRITLALAYQNRRSVPLLRAMSYHLIQKHSELNLSILMDLIFAYGKQLACITTL